MLLKSRFVELFGKLGKDEKGWGLAKLSSCWDVNPPKTGADVPDTYKVSFSPMASVSESGDIDTSEVRELSEVRSGFSSFVENDVLFAKITPCMENGKGAVARSLFNKIGFGSTEFHVLRPKTNLCNPYWLYALTSLTEFRLIAEQQMTGSAGQKRGPAKFLSDFEISIPPIELQNKYVDFTKQLDKSKFLLQQMIEKLELLKKSLFIELFGFSSLKAKKRDWVKLSEVACVVTGTTPKTSVPEYWDGNFKWITPAEINNETKYIYDSARKITEEGIKSASLKPFPKGTVILTSRAPIGKVAIAGDTLYCNQGFKNVICSEKLLPEFLFTLLKNSNSYLNSLGRGATFKEISKQIVDNLKVPAPSLERQKQYNQFEQQIDKLKLVLEKMLEDLVGKA